MKNPYSMFLFIVMIVSLTIGGFLAYNQNMWGLIPMAIAVLMTSGFRTLNASPREIGLIVFLGKKTTWVVEGITLLFNPFGWKIVDVVILGMRKEDKDFPVEKITCKKRGVVTGSVSISFTPDEKGGGEALKQYDDAGQAAGIVQQIDDILVAGCQYVANQYTADQMAANSKEINEELLAFIEGKLRGDTNDYDDTRGLGIKINKLQIKFRKTDEVIEADQRSLETGIMNERIKKRIAFYKKNKQELPSIDEIRKQLIEEDMNADRRLQEIRGGKLLNVNNTNDSSNKKGGKP